MRNSCPQWLLVCGMFGLVLGGASSLAAPPQEKPATADLVTLARQHEQAGEKLKAAEVYEQIIRADPGKSNVLALRLVRIYAEAAQTNKALSWAREVMKKNPDPQAYLAGVHSLLGSHGEARKILEAEVQRAPAGRRKVALCWQLADACDEAGAPAQAEQALGAAIEAAKGTPDESFAKDRLAKFKEKAGEKDPKAPAPK